jgi:hypothetical protein
MNQADEKELAEIRGWKAEMDKREAALLARTGSGGGGGPAQVIAADHREEEDRATLFDKMSSAELMRLYESDRPEWERVCESKRSHGMRKLLRYR